MAWLQEKGGTKVKDTKYYNQQWEWFIKNFPFGPNSVYLDKWGRLTVLTAGLVGAKTSFHMQNYFTFLVLGKYL